MRSRSVPLCQRLVIRLVCFLVLSSLASAQRSYVRPLVNEPVDDGRRVRLKGNTHPLVRPQFDVATAPPNLLMERMLLVLKRSPEQQTALLKLLDDQQDKLSPNYHKWLTPEQFGEQFGPADSDIQAIASWLQSHGFQVGQVSKGRAMIEFSGTAAQVRETFHTAIHKYRVKGESHWANANDPEIPAALAPVVAGVHTLHNFYKRSLVTMSDERVSFTRQSGSSPQITLQGGTHALVPGDYAAIYNINPVYQAGIDGAGTTLAVVGRTDFFFQDVLDFQTVFALPFNFPTIIFNGPDPGNLGGLEEAEALLDTSWSGATAPNAAIRFVVSASTDATDGADLSELYIIDNDIGDVMTESFGGCEAAVTSTQAAGIEALAQQAAAQGITYMVSSGDTGAAGCDDLSESLAKGPVSVNALASTPFTVAVGGTIFNENGHNSTYWNSTNDSSTLASVKSYIPENVWNETCTTQCPSGAAPLAAGGGGASTFFSKPSWQSGVAGIPADNARDVPDVSLTAARHDPYLLCFEGSCQSGSAAAVFGTSAAAPSFAGIMALVREKTGSRLGQANYVLYRLAAAETLSQCNGSKTTALPASNCTFNDVTVGNNAVPGQTGYGTATAKYQSAVGYDLATGLGSVNVANLVNNWSSVAFRPTTTTLTLTPATFVHGTAANVSVGVTPSSGSGVPTGDVSLITDVPSSANVTQGATSFTLNGGTVSTAFAGLPGGNYSVTAHYAGDGTFGSSDSTPVTITVSPEESTTALSVFSLDSTGHLLPFTTQPYGSAAYLKAQVSSGSGHGTASGLVFFTADGINIAGDPYSLTSDGIAATAQGVFNLPGGTHAIVANYNGDQGLNSSVSLPVSVTVTPASTTTAVTASVNSLIQGGQVTLNAIVTTNSGGSGPSGTLTFLSGGVPIVGAGNPMLVLGLNGSGNIQNGTGQLAQGFGTMVATLPAGQDVITAQYSGDSNYTGSTSASTLVTVLADFDLAASAPSITIARPGGSGTATLTIAGQPGFTGVVNFSLCTGLPRESTCSFSPASVTGSGSTTLTITTTAAQNARLQSPGGWSASFGLAVAGVFLLGCGSRRRARTTVFSLITVAFLITIGGCGGSGSGGGGGGSRDPGTPVGLSTVIVSATSGTLTHTATLTLNVQ